MPRLGPLVYRALAQAAVPGALVIDPGALQIPAAVAVLVGGTVVFVMVLTVAARLVDRLIDVLLAVRRSSSGGDGSGGAAGPSGPGGVRERARTRRRGLAGMPRPVVAAMLAGSLLFALAWWTFMLGRIRDLG